MNSTSSPATRPAWADPQLDDADQLFGDLTHPDDRGVSYKSQPVDEWVVTHDRPDGPAFIADEPLRVTVSGFRHETRPDLDWPDSVVVQGQTDPGDAAECFVARAATARRLAAALIKAADLVEGLAGRDTVVGDAKGTR